MKKGGGSGCVGLVLVLFVIGLAVWMLAAALWLFGGLVALGSIALAVAFTVGVWVGVGRRRESIRVAEEVELMAHDCAQDLRKLQYRWAEAATTRGIGTELEEELLENPALADARRRQIDAMITLVEGAPATEQRLEAISKAEVLRHEVEEQLAR